MKFPLTQWSHSHPKGLSTGSRVGVGAGQGLRLEAQVLQASGPWPPSKLCPWGGVGGPEKGWVWWALEGRC